MSNRETIFWYGWGVILIVLFLLSSTDLIIKEKKIQVYPVSVIIQEKDDEFYANFKKGMDKAAEEYRLDVSFVTLYEEKDQKDQMDRVVREIKNGAKALVMAPVKAGEAVMALDEINPGCPVIFLNDTAVSEHVVDTVSMDSYEAGCLLGQAISGEAGKEASVCLFTEGLEFSDNAEIYDGVCSVLNEKGIKSRLFEDRSGEAFRRVIEETVYPGDRPVTVLALDEGSFVRTARILEGSTVYQKNVKGFYGIGSSPYLLEKLDEGIVSGIVDCNRFDQGYLSLRRAVEAIGGVRQKQQIRLKPVYVDRKTIRQKENERIFYPIG